LAYLYGTVQNENVQIKLCEDVFSPLLIRPYSRENVFIGTQIMLALGTFFRVEASFLAMKALSRHQVYVMLPVGATGEILEAFENLEQPGIVVIRVNDERLFIWTRDLRNCTDVPSPLEVPNGGSV
jgi:hypothetical protein